ncbi:MAG: MlaD family protein [Actinomycetota bacterium]|nr:MlaD family protein [Actinomycetota bacterium]
MTITARAWIKAALFTGIGLLCAVLVVNTLSVPVPGATADYVAEFTSVEGLNAGNPVTMNGIRVGRVDWIRFAENGDGTARADVGLEVRSSLSLSDTVTAALRYGDMLGARYVALSDPRGPIVETSTDGQPQSLAAGAVIPLERTTPAVDLTALFNGFKPLFDALEPEQVNVLSRGFAETFSGQGQTVTTLLAQIAAMTSSIDHNAEVFDTLVTNLSALMGSIERREPQLQEMLAGLQRLTTAVSGPDGRFDLMIDQSNAVLATLAATVSDSGAAYGEAITDLKAMLGSWEANTEEFDALVGQLPAFADSINRATSYGGFVSLYLCNFTLKIAKHEANIFGRRHTEVCL